ncbi:MAG: TolC family protein, partial [Deferrisomatales bacterium]
MTAVFAALLALALAAAPAGALTLDGALALALADHPELDALAAEGRAREGAALQAGLRPNPELEMELEDLGAPGGARAAATSFALSQALELGGKRAKRQRAAALEAGLVAWDRAVARLDLVERVSSAYWAALAAQERVTLQEELFELTRRSADTVAERVKAGKVSPIEATQARVELASAQAALTRTRAQAEGARRALAATWGGNLGEADRLDGQLGAIAPLPDEADLQRRLADNPELARGADELAQRKAAAEREEAAGVPDLTVAGGLRTVGGADETTFFAAVSLPLPLFNRNQGAVAEARAQADRARAETRAADRRLRTELAEILGELEASRAEAEALRTQVIPGAEAALEALREGYQWGKFGFPALLEAQRTVVDARSQALDALAAHR